MVDGADREIREVFRGYVEAESAALLSLIEAWLVEWITGRVRSEGAQ